MKVLYILGTQRGGTTIVGRVLGLLPGVAYAGEVRRFWEFGLAPERRCGCADPLADCPVWSVVLDHVRAAGIDPFQVPEWQREVAPAGRSWRSTRSSERSPDRSAVARAGYDRALAATYAGLAAAYRTGVVIDNSKLPVDGALLLHRPGITAYYLHVVRDVRGVVASQLRRRTPDHSVKRTIEAPARAAGWVVRHARSGQVASRVGPEYQLRVRYEDFVAQPNATAAAVCRMLGLPPQPLAAGPFELPAVHTPRGPNPAATMTLVEDIGWRTELNPLQRGLVTAVAAPWLVRDGYLKRRVRADPRGRPGRPSRR